MERKKTALKKPRAPTPTPNGQAEQIATKAQEKHYVVQCKELGRAL